MHVPPPKKNFVLGRPPRNATFRAHPEDFIVDELPAYPLGGQGDHLFVRFEKRNQTTGQAVAQFAKALGVRETEIGVAGQKDKRAVTRQWISLPGVTAEKLKTSISAEARLGEEIVVLEQGYHPHKLRTGHLKGNRFELTLRDVEFSDAELTDFKAQIETSGFGNFFGVQRFRDANLLEVALNWLRGNAKPPRAKRKLKWWMSTVQSALFNAWLSQRIADGVLDKAIAGDVLKKEDTGGLFTCEEPSIDSERVSRWEVSATGPIWGAKMRAALGTAGERELEVLARFDLAPEQFARHKKAGAGSRRPARIRPQGLAFERVDTSVVRLAFTLPKGTYATELLRELLGQEPIEAPFRPA